MDISIILKGPKEFEEGADIVVSEAINYIPGETVEQLISRLLYSAQYPKYGTPKEKNTAVKFWPWGSASEQTIEIRLVRKA